MIVIIPALLTMMTAASETEQPDRGLEVTERNCFETITAVAAGDPVTADMVRPVACSNRTAGRLLRLGDRSGQIMARSDMAPQTFLGRAWLPRNAVVHAGDIVNLRARVGPVEIVRQVRALQDAGAGRPFFAIDNEGHVFVAPSITDQEED